MDVFTTTLRSTVANDMGSFEPEFFSDNHSIIIFRAKLEKKKHNTGFCAETE